MKEKTLNQLANLVGDENYTVLETVAGTVVDAAPFIGKFITSFKIRRLSKRLELNEEKINDISKKLVGVEGQFNDLLKNFLFPSILQQILEEDEDNKTGYFLDGFGNVIDKRIFDESKILILYDTLRKLRFIEIEYLISLTHEYKRYNRERSTDIEKIDNLFDTNNFNTIKLAVESKLEGLGLIDTGRNISYEDVRNNINNELRASKYGRRPSRSSPETKLTTFGREFLNMFSLLDKFEYK